MASCYFELWCYTVLPSRIGVKGYPTVKYFKDGELAFEYGYARTTEGLLDFMRDPREPPPPEPDWTEMENEVCSRVVRLLLLAWGTVSETSPPFVTVPIDLPYLCTHTVPGEFWGANNYSQSNLEPCFFFWILHVCSVA